MSIAAVSGALPAAVAATTSPAATLPARDTAGASGAATATAGASATFGRSGASSGTTAASATQRAATQFERMLLEQLTKELAATAAPADGEASAATSAYRDLLPGTMADALSAAGGVGIAAQLTAATANASATASADTGLPSTGTTDSTSASVAPATSVSASGTASVAPATSAPTSVSTPSLPTGTSS
ncbi:rod-binding protein [Patulibacter sp. NPDC049589]|uniref:rod-binding protein n=1 Tax=Patulibacter sp. NPDC049589 TaxID=3154731 RepID=UPI00341B3F0B